MELRVRKGVQYKTKQH